MQRDATLISCETAKRITLDLGGEWHGSYGSAPAPGHDKRDRSLSIRPHPQKLDDVVLHCFAGEDWRDVKAELRSRGLLPEWKRPDAWDIRDTLRRVPDVPALTAEKTAERRRIALWLWDKSQPADGTIVATYLRLRGICIAPLPATLRFLPANPPKHPHPAMIGCFALPDEPEPGALHIDAATIRGVHLTLIKPDGSGKAGTEQDKIAIGRNHTLPVVLAPPNDGLGLIVAEGIEDALTAHQRSGLGAWAAGSAGRLPGLAQHMPDWIECVTLIEDDNKAGRNGCRALGETLHARNIEVRIERGGEEKTDAA